MTIRMQQRNGTAARWLQLNPILASAEIGYETDTGRFKFGNGTTNWTDLEYYSSVQDLLLGQANGIATLDSSGKIPSAQLNLSSYATTASVTSTINSIIDAAPGTLDTLNELAAAINDDPNFASNIAIGLSAKQDKVAGVSDLEISYLDGVTSNIQTQINNAGPSSTVVSSNISLSKGKYFVDTSSARTLTLPTSPTIGDEIQIFDASGNAGTNIITIANNGNKINGSIDSATLDFNGVAAVFVWTGSTYGWRMG